MQSGRERLVNTEGLALAYLHFCRRECVLRYTVNNTKKIMAIRGIDTHQQPAHKSETTM